MIKISFSCIWKCDTLQPNPCTINPHLSSSFTPIPAASCMLHCPSHLIHHTFTHKHTRARTRAHTDALEVLSGHSPGSKCSLWSVVANDVSSAWALLTYLHQCTLIVLGSHPYHILQRFDDQLFGDLLLNWALVDPTYQLVRACISSSPFKKLELNFFFSNTPWMRLGIFHWNHSSSTLTF